MASKYSNLIFFILLTSLPLFFFMLYYEEILEQTLLESIDLLPPSSKDINPYEYPGIRRNSENSMNPEFSTTVVFLCFLYLVPLHLLELLSAISVVYLASKLHKEEPFTFKEAMRASWLHRGRLKSVFVTSIYLLSVSTCALVGFLWFSIQCYASDRLDLLHPVFIVVYPITVIALLVMFPGLSAIWNMILVVSVVEEVDAIRVFSLASYFIKGSERRGVCIMFVFFALGLGLRVPCLFEDDGSGVGFVARTGLMWVAHLVKWAACTWYYFGCKNKVLQKKADLDQLEVGGDFEGESLKNVS